MTVLSSRLPVPCETLVLKLIQFFLQLESFKFVPVFPNNRVFALSSAMSYVCVWVHPHRPNSVFVLFEPRTVSDRFIFPLRQFYM